MAAGLAAFRPRRIVTAHDAFGWLAARYGLEQQAIAGLSPDQEPDARPGSVRLIDLVEDEGITIFTRPCSPRRWPTPWPGRPGCTRPC